MFRFISDLPVLSPLFRLIYQERLNVRDFSPLFRLISQERLNARDFSPLFPLISHERLSGAVFSLVSIIITNRRKGQGEKSPGVLVFKRKRYETLSMCSVGRWAWGTVISSVISYLA